MTGRNHKGSIIQTPEALAWQCCCRWGAAVGRRRYGKGSGEYPEFGCARCPIHQGAAGEIEQCRRHQAEGAV